MKHGQHCWPFGAIVQAVEPGIEDPTVPVRVGVVPCFGVSR